MKYIDSHCHWADLRFPQTDEEVQSLMQRCLEKDIDFFLQGGVSPEEWLRQIELKKKYPENIGLCFGLHPYYVADHPAEECERALDELAQLLPQAMALGEAGLDFRPHILKESEGLQIEMFENQIALAKTFQKPMVLHVVQAHEKALQIFDIWGAPEKRGMLHAFSGSYETAMRFIDQGFLISVGGAVTYEKNKKLRDCVSRMPLEFLLLESDSPDQPPEGWNGPNEPVSIYSVAEEIGLIRNISPLEVLERNTQNFKRLFSP
ncbi:TatD family hydrolase [Pseudobdellovibrio exovorus]|uniref:TatD family hydrolase n=1 Tax=Pseudobdellovibrio exovorus JSS TaxID=1184267 RepID=M4V9U5_9BACT|nr:TatD family hydrolase [Pseudobdellovibrio exovorus]AGH95230.1 TatD family hydrolase [Pseudobdellovibrio exovorus JSS]